MTAPAPLIRKINEQLNASTATHLTERLRQVAFMAESDDEKAAITFRASEERRERDNDARRKREAVRENHRRRLASDAEDNEAELVLKDRLARSRAEAEANNAVLQQAEDSRTVAKNAIRYMNGFSWKTAQKSLVHFEHDKSRPDPADDGPRVRLLIPTLPEGERGTIVSQQRADIARLKLEIEEVEQAGDRIETTKQRARQMVAETGARGAPTVTGAGEPWSRLAIVPPLLDIGAAPNVSGNGNIPKAPDALALLCWAMPEKIIEAVEASIDEAYLGVELQLDPHERQRRKREIKAKILEAERVECEAIWQMIAAEDRDIRFRPECDPRAILGIAA